MLRKLMARTNVNIRVSYSINGDTVGYPSRGIVESTYLDYHANSNQKLKVVFDEIDSLCGTAHDAEYKNIRSRNIKIELSGNINGKSVDNIEFHSVIEFARFLKKRGVDVGYAREEQSEKAEAGDEAVKLTNIVVGGVINGRPLESSVLRSTEEILTFLNAAIKQDGARFESVRSGQVVYLTKEELRTIAAKNNRKDITPTRLLFRVQDDLDDVIGSTNASPRLGK